MKVKLNDQQIEEIAIEFLKENIEDCIDWGDYESREFKAYLTVLAHHLYIGDFVKYAKEKNLTKYCKKIFKEYDLTEEGDFKPKKGIQDWNF